MFTKNTLGWSIVVAILLGGLAGYYLATNPVVNNIALGTSKQVALYGQMRKLWSDHVFWTRQYMIEAINESPEAAASATRLMENQENIGDAVIPFYGAQAGSHLTELLKQQITIIVDLVEATKSKNQPDFQDANIRWQNNAAQIAMFLSQLNPNWPEVAVADLMKIHLSTTADELSAIVNQQYNMSVTSFDAVHDHILSMSDALSAGIIKQFPDKF